jgi:adenine-specific DNA-methyltransferase
MTLHATFSLDTPADLGPECASSFDPALTAEMPQLLREAAQIISGLSEMEAIEVAHSVTRLATRTVWTARAPDLALRTFPCAAVEPEVMPLPVRAFALKAGQLAASVPASQAIWMLGALYTALLPRSVRKTQGIYYTPPALAALMVNRASDVGTDWHTARIIDPACGAGALLHPALERMLASLAGHEAQHVLDEIGRRLHGVDLDPVAAWLAQVGIDMRLLPWCRRAKRPAPRVIHARDGLMPDAEEGHFDLVLGNPPYGQVRLDTASRTRFARSVSGRANLYALFFQRAIELARPGGVLILLTPTGFMGGQYFCSLRQYLAEEAPPLCIDVVTDRKGVFDGVQQETVVTTCRRAGPRGAAVMRALHVQGDIIDVEPIGCFPLPADAQAPWRLPRRGTQAQIADAMTGMSCRLADWGYRVRSGPTDGSDRTRDSGAGTAGAVPMLWPEAISATGLHWPLAKRGRSAWYQAAGKEKLLVTQPCVLLQRTTALEQSRRLVAAVLGSDMLDPHGAVAVENHVNILEPTGDRPAVPLPVLCALLNSAAANEAFRCLSGSTAVSAYELGHLPLPDPAALEPLAALVASRAQADEIEAECRRLYAGDISPLAGPPCRGVRIGGRPHRAPCSALHSPDLARAPGLLWIRACVAPLKADGPKEQLVVLPDTGRSVRIPSTRIRGARGSTAFTAEHG